MLAQFALCQSLTSPPSPCPMETVDPGSVQMCPKNIPISPPGTYGVNPFVPALMDGQGQSYGDQDGNVVSLYGPYGNDESTLSATSPGYLHHVQGKNLAANIYPRCTDGTIFCSNPVIIFLFIGFSNWDIEIGGATSDIWKSDSNSLYGQPCATQCENLDNPDGASPWGQPMGDPDIEQSLLRQVYPPPTYAPAYVGNHVVLFNGAFGNQTFNKWDPSGYYATTTCNLTHRGGTDPLCNYDRVLEDLTRSGYSPNQVQVVFLKSANPFPQCDMLTKYCPGSSESASDAYQAETYMGNFLRFLKIASTGDVNGVYTFYPAP